MRGLSRTAEHAWLQCCLLRAPGGWHEKNSTLQPPRASAHSCGAYGVGRRGPGPAWGGQAEGQALAMRPGPRYCACFAICNYS